MTRVNLRRCGLICLAALSLAGCKDEDSVIAIYVSKPAEKGFVRKQKSGTDKRPALLPYAETDGYFCVSGEDLELLFGGQISRLENQ